MRRLAVLVVLVLIAIAVTLGPRLFTSDASRFDARHRQLRETNPSGLTYDLQTENGRKRFYIGEPIPVTLRFSSTRLHTYSLRYSPYNDQGRLLTQWFEVDPPQGSVDPLADFYHKVGVTIGPGEEPGFKVLDGDPVPVAAYLNYWVRFDRPGHYRIFARSRQLRQEVVGSDGERHPATPEAVSSMLELEIVEPDESWRQREWERLRLQAAESNWKRQEEAIRAIGFLDTPATREYLVDWLARGYRQQIPAFLLGSRDLDAVRELMERKLVDDHSPASEPFVRSLAFLRVRRLLPFPLPIPIVELPIGSAYWPFYEQARTWQRKISDVAVKGVLRDLAMALPRKHKEVQKSCFEAIEEVDPSYAKEAFPTMATVSAPPQAAPPQVRLDRIRLSDPKAFRTAVLSDLESAQPRLPVYLLTLLPDRELPQLEAEFVRRLPTSPWFYGKLLSRYGTKRFAPQLLALYNREHRAWTCMNRPPILAYFLRAAPQEGKRLLALAVQEGKADRCGPYLFSQLGLSGPSREVEEIAMAALHDDPPIAANAAWALANFGSSRAEEKLWERLEQWAALWRGQPQKLEGNLATQEGRNEAQIRLGIALRRSIAVAQGWHFNEARRDRMLALCWTKQCRLEVEQYAVAARNAVVSATRFPYSETAYGVGLTWPETPERLKQKISQYPSGTTFTWCRDRGVPVMNPLESALALSDIREAVTGQGYHLIENPAASFCSENSRQTLTAAADSTPP